MRRALAIVAVLSILQGCARSAPSSDPSALAIEIDASERAQRILGFGGGLPAWMTLGWDAGDRDALLDFAFGRDGLGVNFVRWSIGGYPEEGGLRPGAVSIWGANDNADPTRLDTSTFKWGGQTGPLSEDVAGRIEGEVMRAIRAHGVTGEYFGSIQGPKWNGFWGRADGKPPPDALTSFNADEMVENKLALLLHYRRYGVTFGMLSPFSEPSGGGIDWPIEPDDVTNVIIGLGRRLEAAGFEDFKMSVPGCTNLNDTITYAKAILSNSDARRYVGALEYHSYGDAGGLGGEDPETLDAPYVEAREELRDLAGSYGLPIRMTEYADSSSLMGRANSVFNELEYAESETYMPLAIFGDLASGHGRSGIARSSLAWFKRGSDDRLSFGPTRDTGVAVGHWSRHVTPGSVRLEASANDRGLRVQTFLDEKRSRVIAVIINNRKLSAALSISIGDLAASERVAGEQTVEGERAYWTSLTLPRPVEDSVSLTVPPRSVTTLELPVERNGR